MKPAPFSPALPTLAKAPPSDSRTDRKRVAIFSDALPERNGAGAYYHDLAAQMQPGLATLELFQPAGKRRSLSLALPLPGDRTQKLVPPNVLRLCSRFHALKPQVVIAVTPGPFGLLGMWLARRAGAGFLTAFHTHFEELARLYGNTLFCAAANRYLTTVNRILCKRSDAVMVNNTSLTSVVQRLGANRVEVIGTPLAQPFLEPIAQPPAALCRVLCAGRFAPEKNLFPVLAAARELPDLEFVLAGDGPLRKRLEDESRTLPNVRITRWLDRESLRREMDATSLLLLPSHSETFGTVALEAMARGRPALVAEAAGIHQWPALREALFVLPKNELLSDALRRLQSMPDEVWREKAVSARRAAEALNRATLEDWAGHFDRYAKRRYE